MAGDWIKWLVGLARKAKVINMAALLQRDRHDVAARLMVVWEWADSETTDGNAPGVTKTFIDELVGVSGFAGAMEKVEWLKAEKGGLSFPNWDAHNSQTAKARALTYQRVRRSRLRTRNGATVTKALPETETETETEKTKTPTAKPTVRVSDCQAVLDYWNEHRGKPQVRTLTAGRQRKLASRLAEPAFAEGWREAIDRLGKAPAGAFVNGSGDRGWRADFDWFIGSDKSCVRLLEGWGQDVPTKPDSRQADKRDPGAVYDLRGNPVAPPKLPSEQEQGRAEQWVKAIPPASFRRVRLELRREVSEHDAVQAGRMSRVTEQRAFAQLVRTCPRLVAVVLERADRDGH